MATHQAPPFLGFSRQEHWSGLPFPSPTRESGKWKWSRSVMSNSQWPHDCSLPGSSIHGSFQASILEWVAMAFSSCIYYFHPIFCKFLFLSQMKNTLHLLKIFFYLKFLVFYFYLFLCSTTIQAPVVYTGSSVVTPVIAAILSILAIGLWPHSLWDSHHYMRYVGCVRSRPEAGLGCAPPGEVS